MSPALTRRGAVCATAAAAIGLAAGVAPSAAAEALVHPNDARLIALADEVEAIDREAEAFAALHRGRETDESEQAFGAIIGRYSPAEQEIAATPAASMTGILAKARAAQVPTTRAFGDCPFALSIADDLVRLFGGGGV